MEFLRDVDGLEGAVGARQLPPLLKSIDFLDEHCTTLLARAPFAVVGYTDPSGGRRAGGVGGAPGFATALGRERLRMPVPSDASPGAPASTLFLIPGWREALRINGRLAPEDPTVLVVEEAFVHCGKAVLRSNLWGGGEREVGALAAGESDGPRIDEAARGFLAACPFVVMVSADARGGADASPKGDPAGFMHVLDDATLAIPDRRGNRRTDTFHNLIEDPGLALLALVPGDDRVLEVRGTGRITDDAALRRTMQINGKVPHAVLVLDVAACALTPCAALIESRLWSPEIRTDLTDLPSAGQIWTDHIKANRARGLKAALLRAAVHGPVIQAGTEVEYKHGLY